MYSNSSFKAMPLWEKHCWHIRAYLQRKEKWTDQLQMQTKQAEATLAIIAKVHS